MADDWSDEPPRSAFGRPSTYTRELVDAILARMNEGASTAVACAENDVAEGTFHGWVVDDRDGLSERYMRARRIRAWKWAEESVEIADDDKEDWIIDDKGKPQFNGKAVQRSHLRVETRKWHVARMLRNEFGEKVNVEHSGGINVAGAATGLAEKLGVASPAAAAPADVESGAGEGSAV